MTPALSISQKNQVLSTLSRADYFLLQPHLEPVELPLRHVLEQANRSIKHVYFPEQGIASVVASDGDTDIEAGIIGWEGMTGLTVVMGDDRSSNSTFMQIAGRGWCIKTGYLREAMRESPLLRLSLLRFVQAFMTQTAQTALANGRATIERRLARWVLMAHDRLEANELPLTHEFLGVMLGVRRAGVTVALHQLEEKALISSARSLIVILDRKGLEKLAGGFYGVSLSEYRRLIGWVPAHRARSDRSGGSSANPTA